MLDLKSPYKQMRNIGDRHFFYSQVNIKGQKEGICTYQLSSQIGTSGITFLGLVLNNRCINLCPEKCTLGQIPIACPDLGSAQLKCFSYSSSSRSLAGCNPNLNQVTQILGIQLFYKLPIFQYLT